MKATAIILIVILTVAAFLTGAVIAPLVKEYWYPTTGEIETITLSVKWLNGTDLAALDWGTTENGTEYVMDPLNITNTSNVPVTLSLDYANPSSSIITLTLTWNYTGGDLNPGEYEVVELYQICIATGVYSYDTIIRGEQT